MIKGLGEKIRAHKLISIIVLIVVLAGIGYGSYYGWQQYQYRKTSDYALEKFRQALSPPDSAALANIVDFNALGGDLAKAVSEQFPFFRQGADQEREINRLLQTALLRRFMEPASKGPQFPEDTSEEAQLKRDLRLLPQDFIEQFLSTLSLTQTDEGNALLMAKINHPQFKLPFTLILAMQKTAQGWKIRHLVNSRELTAQLRKAMLERYAALHNFYVEKNAQTTKKMDQMIPVQSCTADAGLLSDGKTAVLIVHALARNKGDVQINNFNLDTTIRGRSGRPLIHRFLNAAKPVGPGEDFSHRWSFELDSANPETRALLQEGPLQCAAVWHTLGLNNGQVWQIVDEPNPDIACEQPGHDHPQGFCLLPVFQH